MLGGDAGGESGKVFGYVWGGGWGVILIDGLGGSKLCFIYVLQPGVLFLYCTVGALLRPMEILFHCALSVIVHMLASCPPIATPRRFPSSKEVGAALSYGNTVV